MDAVWNGKPVVRLDLTTQTIEHVPPEWKGGRSSLTPGRPQKIAAISNNLVADHIYILCR